ncbi:MAG: FHA domain-containing protein [Gammaproteobacteria bacterium]
MNVEQAFLKPLAGGASVRISGEVLIGRSEECDVVLKGGYPSRRHARLSISEGAARLEDLGSSNGTFVNGERITGAVALKDGDRVRFDILEYDFMSAPAASNMTQLRRPAPPPADATIRVDPAQRAELARPAEAARPAEPARPAETPKPAETVRPADATKPAEAAHPAAAKPAEPARPAATAKPAEPPKPAATPPPAAAPAAAPRKPGSWVDPDSHPEGGTKFLTKEEIEKLRSQSAPAKAAGKVDEPCLEVCSGSSTGKQVKLQGGRGETEWGIGSDASRDIVLGDEGVSAYHAKLVNAGKTWKLIDQMSANGTWVNGRKANISYLSPGDRIKFGPVECVFHAPGGGTRGTARRSAWLIGVGAAVVAAIVVWALWRFLS